MISADSVAIKGCIDNNALFFGAAAYGKKTFQLGLNIKEIQIQLIEYNL